jgi:hypothetical protein
MAALALLSIVVGMAAGLIGAAFRDALERADAFRAMAVAATSALSLPWSTDDDGGRRPGRGKRLQLQSSLAAHRRSRLPLSPRRCYPKRADSTYDWP